MDGFLLHRPQIPGEGSFFPDSATKTVHESFPADGTSVRIDNHHLFAWFECMTFAIGKYVVLGSALERAAGCECSTKLLLLFDAKACDHAQLVIAKRRALHEMFGESLEVIGGGWLAIDSQSRRMILYGKSVEFGSESCRETLVSRLRTALPTWDIGRT